VKIWLLRPRNDLPVTDNPWDPWYDKAFGFVVIAASEAQARELAMVDAGDEKRGEFMSEKTANTKTPWLDEQYSTCVELTADGDERVVIRDFASA
jgi:hypothetical protein